MNTKIHVLKQIINTYFTKILTQIYHHLSQLSPLSAATFSVYASTFLMTLLLPVTFLSLAPVSTMHTAVLNTSEEHWLECMSSTTAEQSLWEEQGKEKERAGAKCNTHCSIIWNLTLRSMIWINAYVEPGLWINSGSLGLFSCDAETVTWKDHAMLYYSARDTQLNVISNYIWSSLIERYHEILISM